MENAQYDAEGQLVTGSFMDYATPRANDTPAAIGWQSHPVPATTNPLGVKGCGEAGCAGAMTPGVNAVGDPPSAYRIRHLGLPASPARAGPGLKNAPPCGNAGPA